MKFLRTNSLIGVVLLCVALGVGATNDTDYVNEMIHDKHAKPTDDRTSLNLSPMMKQHQLRNMRAHLNAIQEIIGLLGQNRFEDASLSALKTTLQHCVACHTKFKQ